MSTFDPSTFMGQVYTEQGETTFKPIPEGDYTASLSGEEKDFAIRVNKGGSVVLDLFWVIEDAQLAATMNLASVRVRQGIFLDLDPNGKLAWGTNQNVTLARLRAALGQNEPGKPWSPTRLCGAGPALVTVKHRADKEDAEKVYSEIAAVNPLQRSRARAA